MDPIKWHRQLGECYCNIGQSGKASTHLECALKGLNEPIPTHQDHVQNLFPVLTSSSLGIDDGSLLPHKRIRTLMRRKGDLILEKQEIVRTLLCLAQVYCFQCRRSLAIYCTIRALNTAQQMGTTATSEFIRSLSGNILSAGMAGKPEISRNYLKIVQEVFPETWGRRS
eukprot:TRINITY_DN5816_c0_g1_i2.p1 TRINITY_DN5816_c0_g1~~TRINITY_DN5816_c0_g1_i2.p1  ORF type:complete len:193 (-),score=39.58 TRINITY_DN5816_c0_g1_i2:499-1005(-)